MQNAENALDGRRAESGDKARGRTAAILSLSLLTVMAGAAIAPALEVIQSAFSEESTSAIQMIVSTPALFIALTSFVFPRLAARFTAKHLTVGALALYVVGGVAGGLFSSVPAILVCRALLGVATGIIMPLSTGLLSFYYDRSKQDRMMGYSSAMNQMGGVVATLATGVLSAISWRASFLVYLMGLPCLVLAALCIPNDCISTQPASASIARTDGTQDATQDDTQDAAQDAAQDVLRNDTRNDTHHDAVAPGSAAKEPLSVTLRRYWLLVLAMFLLMLTFFIYPSAFALETAAEGVIPTHCIAPIMAMLDFVAFLGGLAFARLRQAMGALTRILAPVLFVAGYALLGIVGGWVGTISGSALIGFANGVGVPFIMSTAAQHAGKKAATTVLPLLSMALYAAQFVTPFVLAGAQAAASIVPVGLAHVPYAAALVTGACLLVCSLRIGKAKG